MARLPKAMYMFNAIPMKTTDFKLYYKAMAINTEWYWQIHTTMHTLFLTKAPKTYDGEKTASSTNVTGKSGYLPAEN
jgi:hypothetical protein